MCKAGKEDANDKRRQLQLDEKIWVLSGLHCRGNPEAEIYVADVDPTARVRADSQATVLRGPLPQESSQSSSPLRSEDEQRTHLSTCHPVSQLP